MNTELRTKSFCDEVALMEDALVSTRTCTREMVYRLVEELIVRSCWFMVTPLPDDVWEVTVKAESAKILLDAV